MSKRSLPEGRFLAPAGRLYRVLLVLYRRAFRREFGLQMAQVFRDCCRQAQGERGAVGILSLWAPTLRDFAVTALLERLAEGGHMFHLSRSVLVCAGGVAAMLGGRSIFSARSRTPTARPAQSSQGASSAASSAW